MIVVFSKLFIVKFDMSRQSGLMFYFDFKQILCWYDLVFKQVVVYSLYCFPQFLHLIAYTNIQLFSHSIHPPETDGVAILEC